MNGFDKRALKGSELQLEFVSWLNDNGINYLLSGYEHQNGSENARGIITKQSNNTSLFVRHYPDTTIITINHTILIEVKNSSGIEKQCYDTYMSLKNGMGLNVLLFLKNKMLCRVEDLMFYNMKEYDRIAEMVIPVIDGIWRNPRAMERNQYMLYLGAYAKAKKYTSGSTFAFIDFENTKFIPLERLLLLI